MIDKELEHMMDNLSDDEARDLIIKILKSRNFNNMNIDDTVVGKVSSIELMYAINQVVQVAG